ncbi:MAG: TetR family transcriptional regulator C-terminal domain-containing protein [Pseudomonadota bacterium]
MANNRNPVELQPIYGKAKLKLIEATLESLMDEGMQGCSVRKISDRAGVSVGLVNYHFESIHHLVAAAYGHLALTFLNRAIETAATYKEHPRKQLSVFLQEIFHSEVMQRRVLRAWLVFWGLIDSAPPIQAAHQASNGAFTQYLQSIFDNLAQQTKLNLPPKMAAIGLTAMIDGLWLEWCLQTDAFEPADCIQLCETWVDAVHQ